MSNRCPDCSKFVSLEPSEPEDNGLEVSADGQITGPVRLVLTCAECGSDMNETSLDVDVSCPEAAAHVEEKGEDGHELSLDDVSLEAEDFYESTDAKGRPIPFRYRRHFYGFTATATITCTCGETFEFSFSDHQQASAFDELM